MPQDPIVIANWKMYKTSREAIDYIEHLSPKIQGYQAKVFLAVPFTAIHAAANIARNTSIIVGAQNMSDEREGAFTGEISALMLKDADASFVILGHSERRHLFGEADDFIHRKVLQALSDDLIPVLCIGETEEQRERGEEEEILEKQLTAAFSDVPKEMAEHILVAYEPVWAIGTGKTATPELAQEAHAHCRAILQKIFGKKQGPLIPILYGGSVKPENTEELISQKDIDGLLVGGASLDYEKLTQIVHKCEGAPMRQ